MIPHKEYLQIKEWAEKLKLNPDKELLNSICKISEKHNALKQPKMVEEIKKLKFDYKNKYLQRGQIAINKKSLVGYIEVLNSINKRIDEIMKEKESYQRGSKIAIQMNRLSYVTYCIKHFELKIKKIK